MYLRADQVGGSGERIAEALETSLSTVLRKACLSMKGWMRIVTQEEFLVSTSDL